MNAGWEAWAAEQAAFDPDGLYLALTRFLTGDRTGAEEAYLPYAPAADLLRDRLGEGAGAPDAVPAAPGPRREAISIIETAADGLVLYASDRLVVPEAGLMLSTDDATRAIRPTPVGGPEVGGLRRWRVASDADAVQPGAAVTVRDGDSLLFDGPVVAARPLPADGRVQFRRFSGDALWLGAESAAQAGLVDGPIPLALVGEAGAVWRWGEPTLDKEGRALWRVALDGLVRAGAVQDWHVALAAGAAVSRGRFLSFTDDKDPFWMIAPERAGRCVVVTVVRDRPRQAAGLVILLVTRDGLVLDGEAVNDPPAFAFRARDNSVRFLLPTGAEPAHVSVRRHDKELFRLGIRAARGADAG